MALVFDGKQAFQFIQATLDSGRSVTIAQARKQPVIKKGEGPANSKQFGPDDHQPPTGITREERQAAIAKASLPPEARGITEESLRVAEAKLNLM